MQRIQKLFAHRLARNSANYIRLFIRIKWFHDHIRFLKNLFIWLRSPIDKRGIPIYKFIFFEPQRYFSSSWFWIIRTSNYFASRKNTQITPNSRTTINYWTEQLLLERTSGWLETSDLVCTVWQYGLWSFQAGDTKLERFLPKNQHTQRKWLNFEFWINGELSKSAKIWLSKSIFYVKNHPNLSQFFSLKNTNLGAHFLLMIFFDKINF